jgi:transcriptional regulator with XRE-family HTH domain
MQVTGTREAFIELISQRGFAKAYSVDKTLVSQWRSGKRVPSLDKMEEVLTAAGAAVIQEKVWEIK